MKRIHIIGSGPRTGTTLLHEVMKVCFNIDKASLHEDSIVRSYSSFDTDGILLTKMPDDILSVKIPLWLDSNLYVICIIRDPRDMVVSTHNAFPGKYFCSLKYWNIFYRNFDSISRSKRFIQIKYEDFTKNPDEVQKYISDKIPFLNSKFKFSEYHFQSSPSVRSLKALKKLRPIDSKGVGKWKNHLPRIKEQMKKHGDITESLIRFGYEDDKSWIGLLDEIEPSYTDSALKEYFGEGDIKLRKRKGMYASVKILIEKLGLNPEKILAPIKRIYRNVKD